MQHQLTIIRTDIIFNSDDGREIKVLVAQDDVGERYDLRDLQYFLVDPSDDDNCIQPQYGDIMSTPHSTSFLDLNGDCMPDIFMQKMHREQSSMGQEVYSYYHEILLSRRVHGQQQFCL